jgi:hypothetical protein
MKGWKAIIAAAALAATGTGCVHEVLQPVRETTLAVARAGENVTISWLAEAGTYYTVMYSKDNGAKAKWMPLEDATDILGTGAPVVVMDRTRQIRYYRLVESARPAAR